LVGGVAAGRSEEDGPANIENENPTWREVGKNNTTPEQNPFTAAGRFTMLNRHDSS